MSITRLEYLFQRYLNREATAGEHQELMLLLQQSAQDAEIKTILNQVWQNLTVHRQLAPERADAIFHTILSSNPANSIPVMPVNERRPRRLLPLNRWAVAAAVLVLVATGGWLFYLNRSTPPVATTNTDSLTNDIAPGKNNAVLILADGRTINLDSTANGDIGKQENTVISKREGVVEYSEPNLKLKTKNSLYNTITTARGNQYKLILPDGSTVWLNAESSVRFPVAFTGNERRVEVTGEVYLAVKHNSQMPFKVVANGVEVKDLGTEFDVNAYEGLVTTVVEGKVSVGKAAATLTAGQQAIVSRAGSNPIKLIKDADVEAAIAWKNGQFMFTGNSIQSVMQQLERWYDIEVTYGPHVSKEEFVGTMTRFANISSVLKMLEKTGTVHFEVHGRKVLVK
ncbi:hypothetical protein A3860_35660 [Niastella vici]|uniref:Iron dicitrate transport regulator FecR n=1 Tax=Niastella vici TaxID=1703345 RepID=A0A1V9FNI8_9BACT|nr:FecR family protein [Niastella vici]OQP59929.1 hypothetical protein A3860_35660 [Niastella vici]